MTSTGTFSEIFEQLRSVIAEPCAEPCTVIVSIGSGSGKYSRALTYILSKTTQNVILAIDTNFKDEIHRSNFMSYFSGSVPRPTVFFIHEAIPSNYPRKTLSLGLRSLSGNVLFGFSDACIPHISYPLLPYISIFESVLRSNGRIIVHNEAYFYGTGMPIEHDNDYYKWRWQNTQLPDIYGIDGQLMKWGNGLGRFVENEHMQDMCEIPYIMRQLRPTTNVLYLDRGGVRPFLITHPFDVPYDDPSGYAERAAVCAGGGNIQIPESITTDEQLVIYIMSSRNLDMLRKYVQITGIRRTFGLHTWSYLHYAVLWGFQKGVEFLLRHGADVNALTRDGKTPLDFTYTSTIVHEIDMKDIRDILVAMPQCVSDPQRVHYFASV